MSFISLEKPVPDFQNVSIGPPRPNISKRFLLAKRIFDIVLAVLLLPWVVLICLVVLALNPFFNPGSLLFWQTRIGLDEKSFRIYKLRTMTGSNDKACLDADETHRITRLGSFLRSKRIDELPQVVNILMGQMSFIGPRPEQRELYEEILELMPNYSVRQMVRPGISGLAQVESGYARQRSELRAKLRYDMHYIHNMGFGMDLYITVRTFKVLITGFGAK